MRVKRRTAVCGVQQDGGLADDPALVAGEGDAGEAVVDACVLLCVRFNCS